jgi:lipopolysaccharide transport system ATP-binding protein
MDEVASQQGRTVLLVSHQMGMITSLCRRAILLQDGSIVREGSPTEVVAAYYAQDGNRPYAVDYSMVAKKPGDAFATLLAAAIIDATGHETGEIDIRSDFEIVMRYALHGEQPKPPAAQLHFYNAQGVLAFATVAEPPSKTEEGVYESRCKMPGNFLNNDTYFVDVALAYYHAALHVSFHERNALTFVVHDPIEETLNTRSRSGYSGAVGGVIRPILPWSTKRCA